MARTLNMTNGFFLQTCMPLKFFSEYYYHNIDYKKLTTMIKVNKKLYPYMEKDTRSIINGVYFHARER